MIQVKGESSQSIRTKSKFFQAWKAYSRSYKQSIQNNIIANHFYLQHLFRKTIQSLHKYPRQPWLRSLFIKFKEATLTQTRNIHQLQSILKTNRRRRAIHEIIEVCRQRRKCKRIVKVSARHSQLQLMNKYFHLFRANTLFVKFSMQIQKKLKSHYFSEFITKASTYLVAKKINKQGRQKALRHYCRHLKEKYFKNLTNASSVDKYLSLKRQLLKKSLVSFMKIVRHQVGVQNHKAKKIHRTILLRKYFSCLSNGIISLKATKLSQKKKLSRCFCAWFHILQQSKEKQSNIPIEIVDSIQESHRLYQKKHWFNKILSICNKRIEIRNRRQMVTDYYELKTTEILYRKYFDRMKLFHLLSKADKIRNESLLSKSLQGFQLNYINEGQKKIKLSSFLQKKDLKLTRKTFQLLRRCVQKKQSAMLHFRRRLMKTYLEKWLVSIVSSHLQKVARADQYYKTNTKYKVMFAFKKRVSVTHNMLGIIRMRAKNCLSAWVRDFRVQRAQETRNIQIKARVFRHLKFLRYTKQY